MQKQKQELGSVEKVEAKAPDDGQMTIVMAETKGIDRYHPKSHRSAGPKADQRPRHQGCIRQEIMMKTTMQNYKSSRKVEISEKADENQTNGLEEMIAEANTHQRVQYQTKAR